MVSDTSENNSKEKKSDFPGGLLLAPILSERSLQALHDLLEDKVEFLPLIHKEGNYCAINVMNTLDCIDEENSISEKLRSGAVKGYSKFAFIEEIVRNETIFKAYVQGTSRVLSTKVFVTDSFKNRVLDYGLLGFEFIEVWDSGNQFKFRKNGLDIMGDIDFDNALKKIKEKDLAYAGGHWKIQLDDRGKILLGRWDGESYLWSYPIYYPPVILGLMWKLVEKSKIYSH